MTPKHVSGTIKALADVLEWYGEQARLARLIHKEGDAGRHALANDGGRKAREILAAIQPDPEPKPVAWLFEGSAFETEAEAKHACNCALLTFDRILPVYATPSSAGMVSVEAAGKFPSLEAIADEIHETYREMLLGQMPTELDVYAWVEALRALAGGKP